MFLLTLEGRFLRSCLIPYFNSTNPFRAVWFLGAGTGNSWERKMAGKGRKNLYVPVVPALRFQEARQALSRGKWWVNYFPTTDFLQVFLDLNSWNWPLTQYLADGLISSTPLLYTGHGLSFIISHVPACVFPLWIHLLKGFLTVQ